MPVPTDTQAHLRPSAWPPSPGHMPPSLDEDCFTTDDEFDTPLLQENPLTYFLTPPTPKHEELEFDFDFDAGIEDSSNPREMVRSISPSTLDGLKKYKPRSQPSECAILDDEDDEDDEDGEEYIRLQPNKSLPFGFEDYFDRPKKNKKSASALSQSADSFLSPASFHVGSLKQRPSKRFAPPRRPFRGRSPTLTLTRRHSWREPSPDVWSIEEEPDKETMSEMGMSWKDLEDDTKTQPIDIPAAKPKKKVRFVLPAKE